MKIGKKSKVSWKPSPYKMRVSLLASRLSSYLMRSRNEEAVESLEL